MGLFQVARAVCDQCDEQSAWFDTAIFDRNMVLRELREDGWVISRLDGRRHMLCPDCAAKRGKVAA